MIDLLYSGEVLTATQCAARVGITPSAMSYHLRALEKHGIVVRAPGSVDGRERPWMRAGDTLVTALGADGGAGGIAAATLLLEQSLRLDLERMTRAGQADRVEPDRTTWRGTTTYNRDLLVLTPDEARDLAAEVQSLFDRYLADRRRGKAPRAASTFSASFLLARDPDG